MIVPQPIERSKKLELKASCDSSYYFSKALDGLGQVDSVECSDLGTMMIVRDVESSCCFRS